MIFPSFWGLKNRRSSPGLPNVRASARRSSYDSCFPAASSKKPWRHWMGTSASILFFLVGFLKRWFDGISLAKLVNIPPITAFLVFYPPVVAIWMGKTMGILGSCSEENEGKWWGLPVEFYIPRFPGPWTVGIRRLWVPQNQNWFPRQSCEFCGWFWACLF